MKCYGTTIVRTQISFTESEKGQKKVLLSNAFSLFLFLSSFSCLSFTLPSAFKRMPLSLLLSGRATMSVVILCYLAVKQWDANSFKQPSEHFSILTVVNCQSCQHKQCGSLTDVTGIIFVWTRCVAWGYRPL